MKVTLILISLLTISTSFGFEKFQTVKKAYAQYVAEDNSSYKEMHLELSFMSQKEHKYIELSRTLKLLTSNMRFDGLENLNVQKLKLRDNLSKNIAKINHELGKGWFYCNRFHNQNCKKTRLEFINEVMADTDIDRAFLVTATGNYYGDWGTVFLILENRDENLVAIIEFDLIHEI